MTEKQLKCMKAELRTVVNMREDSVMICKLPSEKYFEKEELGKAGYRENDIL